MADVCACHVDLQSNRGIVPCMYHADVIREHQQMYRALQEIASGTAAGDLETMAHRVIANVRYRHAR